MHHRRSTVPVISMMENNNAYTAGKRKNDTVGNELKEELPSRRNVGCRPRNTRAR